MVSNRSSPVGGIVTQYTRSRLVPIMDTLCSIASKMVSLWMRTIPGFTTANATVRRFCEPFCHTLFSAMTMSLYMPSQYGIQHCLTRSIFLRRNSIE